mgnify:CR=1 FL=1
MKKIFIFVLGLMVSLWANAFSINDGILYYDVTSGGQAWVTGPVSGWFDGNVTIRSTVKDKSTGISYPIIGIDKEAFKGWSVTNVTIESDDYFAILEGAFKDCATLTFFRCDDAILDIGADAFNGTGLTTLSLPHSAYIGPRAFANCSNLTVVGLKDMDEYDATMFDNSPIELLGWDNGLTSEVHNAVSGQSPFYGIRNTLKTVLLMKDAPARLCYQFPNLEKVSINSGVNTIGDEAFRNCPKLSTIGFTSASGLTTIGKYAFAYNVAKELDLTGATALTTIDENAFYGCTKLDEFILASSASVQINENAFAYCNIFLMQILNSVGTIHQNAFKGAKITRLYYYPAKAPNTDYASASASPFNSLTDLDMLVIGRDVKKVGAYTFSGLSKLSQLIFAGMETGECKLETIGEKAFESANITYVNLPSSLKSIGNRAFSGTQIAHATIPEGVTQLGYLVFGNTLTELNYNATNATYIGGTTNGIFQVDGTIKIGSNVTDIPAQFSVNAQKLNYIAFPESVVRIGNKAFYNNGNMSSVSLPVKIQSIGSNAFGSCAKLKTLTISGNVPDPNGAFNGTTITTIYCNCNNESAVKSKWTSVCSDIVSQGTGDYTLPTIAESYMTGKGTVEWGDANGCDPNRTLTAIPNTAAGYKFVEWSDGETQNPRTINLQTFNFEGPFYALFAADNDYVKFNITVVPADGATISFYNAKTGERLDKDAILPSLVEQVRIVPSIKSNYEFISWEYESSSAVNESSNTHQLWIDLTAKSYPTDYTLNLKAPVIVTVKASNSKMGSVSAVKNSDGTWDIAASASYGYQFDGWDDDGDGQIDNTEAYRTVSPTESTTYTAYFSEKAATYSIYVTVCCSGEAEVVRLEGDLTNIAKGEVVTLQAILGENTVFRGWYVDGVLLSMANPFILTQSIGSDYDVTCQIEGIEPSENSFMGSVLVQPEEGGIVSSNIPLEDFGYGQFSCYVPENFEWILTAVPTDGYEFVGWEYYIGEDQQSVTDNPLYIYTKGYDEIMPIIQVVASFQLSTGIVDVQGNKEQVQKVLRNGQILIIRDGKTYNVLGAEVK